VAVVCHSSAAAQQRQNRLPTKFTNRARAQQLEGAGVPYESLPESLQRIMEDLDYQI
jgi:hypothetical protein